MGPCEILNVKFTNKKKTAHLFRFKMIVIQIIIIIRSPNNNITNSPVSLPSFLELLVDAPLLLLSEPGELG